MPRYRHRTKASTHRAVRKFIRGSRRILSMIEDRVEGSPDSSQDWIEGHRDGVLRSASYNMVTSESEEYYSDQYLAFLGAMTSAPMSILDLGTGQGRIACKLGSLFPSARLLGYDLSAEAIAFANQEKARRSITNIEFEVGDIKEVLASTDSATYDLVVFTEVALFLDDLDEQLKQMSRVLRPGGYLAASFRSTYFNALLKTKAEAFSDLERIVASNSGILWESSGIRFNWHSSKEISEMLAAAEMRVELLAGIGVLSGIRGDPHYSFARPESLDRSRRETLMAVECQLGLQVPDAGRYIFVLARRDY